MGVTKNYNSYSAHVNCVGGFSQARRNMSSFIHLSVFDEQAKQGIVVEDALLSQGDSSFITLCDRGV